MSHEQVFGDAPRSEVPAGAEALPRDEKGMAEMIAILLHGHEDLAEKMARHATEFGDSGRRDVVEAMDILSAKLADGTRNRVGMTDEQVRDRMDQIQADWLEKIRQSRQFDS